MTVFVIVLLLSLAIIIRIIMSSNAQTNKKRKNNLGIDEPFFHNVNTECISIRKFMDKLASDSHYMERMDTIIKGEIEVGNEIVTEPWDKLRYYLLADLLRCQRGLNRPFVLSDPENLGFILVSLHMTDTKPNITYKNLEPCYQICMNSINSLLKSIHDSLPSQEDVFLIEHTIKGYDHALHEEYVRHLFWFTSLIAQNSSPTPTNAEKEWLNHLISLKEEGK
jgi:hypothetical protein